MTEFSALASAVVRKGVDITAALAMSDCLEERGDERGRRLRRRVRMYEKRLKIMYEAGAELLDVGFIDKDEYDDNLAAETDRFIRYFFRLLSVASGEPTPRERVGGSCVLIEPNA